MGAGEGRSPRRGATAAGISVLHLDDNESFLQLAETALERESDAIEVETATSADEALETLAEAGIDCVVSDYQMPGTDGLEFLRMVREDHPDLPFLLFTGEGSEAVAGEAISAGVTDYLQKEQGAQQFTVLANRIENAVAGYRAEQRAAASDQQVQRMYARITDAVVALDHEWCYTHMNQQAAELLDRSRDDLLGRNVWEAFPELDGTAFEEAFRGALETQESTTVEAYFDPLDTWFEARVYPDDDGLSVYFRDVSGRKERERRFEAIFDRTYQFIGLMEPDGTLIEANETALEFGGLDREDVVGEPFWRAGWWQTDETTVERLRDAIDRAADGEFVRYEVAVQGARENTVIDFSINPVRDETGEVVLLIPEGRDITEFKRRERELRRQNERLEELASVVSHEFRTPLNAVREDLALALETGDDQFVEDAREAIARMERLVDDLLDLAEQGQVVSDPRPVDVYGLLQEAATNSGQDVQVAVECRCSDGSEVLADERRLRRLVDDLVRNAVEHGEGGTVRVGCRDGGLYVDDDGPGIPREERDRVFEPGHSTVDDSTGFGLSVVRRIADAHGWDVVVTESESGGARFEVTGLEAAPADGGG